MFRGDSLQVTGKAAILATLLGGSSMAFAQEAAPVIQPTVAPPVQQAPAPQPVPVVTPEAAPVVQPPAAVRTIPDASLDTPTVRAEAEPTAPRRRAAAPAPRAVTRAAEPAAAANPVVINEPPAVTDSVPVQTTTESAIMENSAATAPIAAEPVEQNSVMAAEDWTLASGIAAVLAALGLGAFAMRRRRRAVNDNDVAPVAIAPTAAAPIYTAPRPITTPIKEALVFQYAASTPAEDRLIQRAPVMTRPDVPITDPLFSHQPVAAPITDPMFAPRHEVEPPITDPIFAKHDRFVGRGGQASAREPELLN